MYKRGVLRWQTSGVALPLRPAIMLTPARLLLARWQPSLRLGEDATVIVKATFIHSQIAPLPLSPAQGARAFSEAEEAQLAAVLGLDAAGVRAVVDVSVGPARYGSTRHFELSFLELYGVL